MTPSSTPQQYFAELPRKRFASAAMIFESNRLLIVKTSYKEGWVLPGGGVDSDEGLYAACVREVREEVGLTVTSATFGGTAFLYQNPVRGDVIETFWICDVDNRNVIKIDNHEIIDFMWATRNECEQIMRVGLGFRTLAVWDAWTAGRAAYIENDKVF